MNNRPEIEKTKLAGKVPLEKEYTDLLENVSGTVFDVCGGIGRMAEYLSDKGCTVTLLDPNRLNFSYRRNIVPNSKVLCWNKEPSDIKLNKPVFDYVIIRGSDNYDLAKRVAKKGIINLTTREVENVVHTNETPTPTPEVTRTTGINEEPETSPVQSDTPEEQYGFTLIPDGESLGAVE